MELTLFIGIMVLSTWVNVFYVPKMTMVESFLVGFFGPLGTAYCYIRYGRP